MPPAFPLITLLTDFGTKDYFAASMKGVILTINPAARIIDITHDIPPYRIDEASYCLQACYRTFPEGTVHVVIVDPGVGSSRRPILVKTARYYFVAPDNGVLTPTLEAERDVQVWHLENPRFRLESAGATFHGRDLFAPAAAWLSKGEEIASFGRPIHDPVKLVLPQPIVENKAICGRIVYVDGFGNLISNISRTDLDLMDVGLPRNRLRLRVGESTIQGMVGSYSDGVPGMLQALINSNGKVEIFMKEQRAADNLHGGVGAKIVIEQ